MTTRREIAQAGFDGDDELARRSLDASEPTHRATALTALDRLGKLDDDTLAPFLDDPAPEVRRRAAALAAYRPGIHLEASLRDADPLVAETAAWSCGEQQMVDTSTLATLIDLTVAHQDPLVREAAVAALGAIGDDAALPAVLGATTDKPAIRRRAVIALAAFEGPDVDAALKRAVEDKDWQVRDAADELLRIEAQASESNR